MEQACSYILRQHCHFSGSSGCCFVEHCSHDLRGVVKLGRRQNPPNGGFKKGMPSQNAWKNSGLGIVVICPDTVDGWIFGYETLKVMGWIWIIWMNHKKPLNWRRISMDFFYISEEALITKLKPTLCHHCGHLCFVWCKPTAVPQTHMLSFTWEI